MLCFTPEFQDLLNVANGVPHNTPRVQPNARGVQQRRDAQRGEPNSPEGDAQRGEPDGREGVAQRQDAQQGDPDGPENVAFLKSWPKMDGSHLLSQGKPFIH